MQAASAACAKTGFLQEKLGWAGRGGERNEPVTLPLRARLSRTLDINLKSLDYLPWVGIEEPSKAFKQGIFILKGKLQSSVWKGFMEERRQGNGASPHSRELHTAWLFHYCGELGHIIWTFFPYIGMITSISAFSFLKDRVDRETEFCSMNLKIMVKQWNKFPQEK